jgi:hypothetical protein
MADGKDRQQIQNALARMIVELSADGTTLDPEDRDVLTQYAAGAISRDAMMDFFATKPLALRSKFVVLNKALGLRGQTREGSRFDDCFIVFGRLF